MHIEKLTVTDMGDGTLNLSVSIDVCFKLMDSDLGAKFKYAVYDDHEYAGQKIIVLTISTNYLVELSELIQRLGMPHKFVPSKSGLGPLRSKALAGPRWTQRKGT